MGLVLVKILFILVHICIGKYDFSFYRIPNALLAALLILYGFYAPFYLGLEQILNSLIVFSVVLFSGFLLYAFKFMGAGDIKYLAVASIWVGTQNILQLLILIAIVGGILGIFYLFLGAPIVRFSNVVWEKAQTLESRYPPLQKVWIGSGAGAELGKREPISNRAIPYGVAIALGSIILMLLLT